MKIPSTAKLEQALAFAIKATNPLTQSFKKFSDMYEYFLQCRAQFWLVIDKLADCLDDFGYKTMYYALCLVGRPVYRAYCMVFLGQACYNRYKCVEQFCKAQEFFSQVQNSARQFLIRLYLSEQINCVEELSRLTVDNFKGMLDNYTEIYLLNMDEYSFLLFEGSWYAETLLITNSSSFIAKKYENHALVREWLRVCLFCAGDKFIAQWHVIKELLIEQIAVQFYQNKNVFVQLFIKLLIYYCQNPDSQGFEQGIKGVICALNERLLCKISSYKIFDLYVQILKTAPRALHETIVTQIIDPFFDQVILQLKPCEISDAFAFTQFLLLVFDYADSDFVQAFVARRLCTLFQLLQACDQRNAEIFFTKFTEMLILKEIRLDNALARLFFQWARVLMAVSDFMYEETVCNICKLLTTVQDKAGLLDYIENLSSSSIAYSYLLAMPPQQLQQEYAQLKVMLQDQQRLNMYQLLLYYDEELEHLMLNYKLELLKYYLAHDKFDMAALLFKDLEAEVATTRDKAELELIKMCYGKADVPALAKLVFGAVCEFEVLCEVGYWQKCNGESVSEAITQRLMVLRESCAEQIVEYANLAAYVLGK